MMKIRKCIRPKERVQEAHAEINKKLDTADGNKIIYKQANTRNRRTTDICDNSFINDEGGTDTTKITDVWQEYCV